MSVSQVCWCCAECRKPGAGSRVPGGAKAEGKEGEGRGGVDKIRFGGWIMDHRREVYLRHLGRYS